MINKNIKTVFSIVAMTTCLFVFAAPKGMCLPVSPQITAGVAKPALRSNVQPSSLKLEGDISISKKNPKISLSLRNSDVKQVLRMFADKAGLNIIFHTSVDTAPGTSTTTGQPTATQTTTQPTTTASNNSSAPVVPAPTTTAGSPSTFIRKVTLDLVNVPLNDAFRMVMQVADLTYYIDKNTIVIADATAAQKLNLAKQELTTIPVKYVDATALADFLNKNIFSINKPGLSNSQIAVTNPSSNEILIFGTKNDYLMAKKVIAQFDIKPLEETFTVNHTTPKEMADLLCKVLFKVPNSSSSASSTSSSAVGDLSLGAGVVACQMGGSSTSGSSSTTTSTPGSLYSLNNTALLVTYFAQRGAISVVGGSAQQMEMVKSFIAKNDKKQPQALLEVSIIELNEDGSKTFNNSWQVWSSFFSGSFNGTTATNPLYPNFFGGDKYDVVDTSNKTDPTKVLYSLSKFSGTPMATYTMNYLIKNQKGRVLANPKIIITNGQQSTIDLSSDYVKSVSSEYIQTTGSQTPTAQKKYEIGNDNGIKVELTPFISLDGYVTLNIKPVYATIKETIPDENGDPLVTLLQRRNLDLKNIRLKDGETLVIGGMIQEVETKGVSKMPVLSDLPGIGMFFRNTTNIKSKQELVIMITPKIVQDSEDVVSKPSVAL